MELNLVGYLFIPSNRRMAIPPPAKAGGLLVLFL